jgi:RNase P/RNase MRP subunit p29
MQNKEILIGSRIRVNKSSNKQLEGMTGEVIDETRNTLTIKTKKGTKRLIRKQIKIEKIR